jgi:exopolysaccharide production protein ExoQ
MIYIACVIYMLLPTEAPSFIDRMIYGEWPGKPGDKLTEALNLLAIGVGFLLFCWGSRRLRRPGFNRVLPLAAAGLLVTSVLWSIAPGTTITRSLAYLFLVVGAIGTVEIFDAHRVMRLTALIGGFLAAISLILPDAAGAIIGALRGPFPGKNQLGQAMVIGVLGGLHGIRISGGRRLLYISITVLCTIVAFLSKSATSLVAIFTFFLLCIIMTLYTRGGGGRIMSIGLMIVAAASFVILVTNIDFIFSVLEKDPTLTGRTDFWPYIIDYVNQRPLLGWGFAAFWILSNPSAAELDATIGYYINEAHNGILQLLLDVGIVGTAFFLILWIRNFLLAVKCIHGLGSEVGVSSLLLLVGILVIGVSEQVLTTVDGITAQFFLLGFMCEKELRLSRQARAAVALRSAAPHLREFAGPREGNAV